MNRVFIPIVLEATITSKDLEDALESGDLDRDYVTLISDKDVDREEKIKATEEVVLSFIRDQIDLIYGELKIVSDIHYNESELDWEGSVAGLSEEFIEERDAILEEEKEIQDSYEFENMIEGASPEQVEEIIEDVIARNDQARMSDLLWGYSWIKNKVTPEQKQKLEKVYYSTASKISKTERKVLLQIDNMWLEKSSEVIADLAERNKDFAEELDTEEEGTPSLDIIDYYLTSRLLTIKSELMKENITEEDLELLINDLLEQFKIELTAEVEGKITEEV